MIDNVLITVRYKNIFEKDMELPAQVDVTELCTMLLETLKTAESIIFSDIDKISIKCKGKFIKSGTLFASGVWDGSTIEII